MADRGEIEGSDPSLTGGGRWGMVPADVLVDRRLSRSARWLFSLLCSHANKASLCRVRLQRIADAEQASPRSVQKWLRELEEAGRVVRYAVVGKADVYRVIRDPAKVTDARVDNAAALKERQIAFTPPRRPAPAPVDNPVDGVSEAAESRDGGGEARCTRVVQHSAPPKATVVQHGSPPSEQDSTKQVQQLSGPDPGTPAMAAGDAGARQEGAGGSRRRGKSVDRRQPAMLMPIEGGKPMAAEGSEPQAHGLDPGLDHVLRLILAAVERLLDLNRQGLLTEAEIKRVVGGITDKPARAAGDGGAG